MATVIDGVYILKEKVGAGGMAAIFLAEVDHTRFDYTTLYAYTQVQAETHTERRKKAEELAKKFTDKELDLATVRTILETQNIPLPGKHVAVKVATGAVDLPRFEGEWKNLLCLNHDNVIKVYGGGIYQKRPYYAMELLSKIISPDKIKSTFTIRGKLGIIIQAGRGLAYLHGNGLIHRDVKPDNLVTCRDESGKYVTRVTDLGLAKNLEEDLGLTMSQTVMGTPYYMSPEQLASTKDVEHHADIYSLGASLYEFVTGVRPFHNKTTVYEIIAAVGKGEVPTPPKEHMPDLPDSIASIIECAMARDAGDRYEAVADMVQDLEAYLENEAPEITQSINYDKADKSKSSAMVAGKYIFQKLKRKAAQRKVAGRRRPVKAAGASPKVLYGGIALGVLVVVGLLFALLGGEKPESKKPTGPREERVEPARDTEVSEPAESEGVARAPAKKLDSRQKNNLKTGSDHAKSTGMKPFRFLPEPRKWRSRLEKFDSQMSLQVVAPVRDELGFYTLDAPGRLNARTIGQTPTAGGGGMPVPASGEWMVRVSKKGFNDNDLKLLADEIRSKSISGLSIFGSEITDSGLAYLRDVTSLKYLELVRNPWISDAGLVHLKSMTNLQYLSFYQSPIGDGGLEHLKSLTALTYLNLGLTKFSDAGLAHIQNMIKLEQLVLTHNTKLTDTGLTHLRKLNALKTLELGARGSRLTDAGLAHLKDMTGLQYLSLWACTRITDEGLRYLSGLSNLKSLDLMRMNINGSGLAYLSRLSRLERLYFYSSKQLQDEQLKHLQALKSLKYLDLRETCIGDAGLKHLGKLTALEELFLSGTGITDAGLVHLAGLQALRHVDLAKTKATHKDISTIRAAPGTGPSTPLHNAAKGGHSAKIRRLIANGADVDARDQAGNTPLHYAAQNGHSEAAKTFLESGADINAVNAKGATPLQVARGKGHSGLSRVLEQYVSDNE